MRYADIAAWKTSCIGVLGCHHERGRLSDLQAGREHTLLNRLTSSEIASELSILLLDDVPKNYSATDFLFVMDDYKTNIGHFSVSIISP